MASFSSMSRSTSRSESTTSSGSIIDNGYVNWHFQDTAPATVLTAGIEGDNGGGGHGSGGGVGGNMPNGIVGSAGAGTSVTVATSSSSKAVAVDLAGLVGGLVLENINEKIWYSDS